VGEKDVVMNNSPESTANGIVPVLSISPMEEDHFFLQNILSRLQGTLDPRRTFKVSSCATLASGLAALGKRQFELVVCERDLTRSVVSFDGVPDSKIPHGITYIAATLSTGRFCGSSSAKGIVTRMGRDSPCRVAAIKNGEARGVGNAAPSALVLSLLQPNRFRLNRPVARLKTKANFRRRSARAI
jgi:hypothetical protein